MADDFRRRPGAQTLDAAGDEAFVDVLDVVRRLEQLRGRGLDSVQMAQRIRLTHPQRPGGGPWTPASVEQVLRVADATRSRTMSTPPPPRTSYPSTATTIGNPQAGRKRRLVPWTVGLIGLAGLAALAFGLDHLGVVNLTGRDGTGPLVAASNDANALLGPTGDGPDADTTGDRATGDIVQDGGLRTESAPAPAPSTGAPGERTPGGDVATSDGTDTLIVRIEPTAPAADGTSVDGGVAAASATIRTDGKLYIEGAFRSQAEADRFLQSATEVFGAEALVDNFTIDPTAPDPTVSDVVLEKPVLFKAGSAEIDPEYIPFLAACGDVLKLNPGIVMSVAGFTDASGDAQMNLELSQQRADAIIDFYRGLEIEDEQLLAVGFGETDFVAANDTEAGRAANRRAMLELLNVMRDG